MWIALAYTYADCNGNADCDGDADCPAEVFADAQAASHAAAPALRPAFNGHFFGDSRSLASPRNAYFSRGDYQQRRKLVEDEPTRPTCCTCSNQQAIPPPHG